MKTFTRYLDAVRFAIAHNVSVAAIQKTGQWQWTVFIDENYIVSNNGRPFPVSIGVQK